MIKSQPVQILIPKAASAFPRFSGITVIPDWGLGHALPQGESIGAHTQADVVDGYVQRLFEELESESVMTTYLNTRRAPTLKPEERPFEAEAGHIPLICSCDFYARERTANSSVVEFSGGHLRMLADRIGESMRDWGKCSSFDHRGSLSVLLNEPTPFIRIKPFAINGTHAEFYLKRLDQLAIAVGRAIGDFFAERNLLRRRR